MKALKNFVALATTVALLGATGTVCADEYCTDVGGCGYAESRRMYSVTPAIALGTIAIVAIIAVAIQNGSSSHSHAHD